jgi:hypothetical protein
MRRRSYLKKGNDLTEKGNDLTAAYRWDRILGRQSGQTP